MVRITTKAWAYCGKCGAVDCENVHVAKIGQESLESRESLYI